MLAPQASENVFRNLADGHHQDPNDDTSKVLINFYTKGVHDPDESAKAGRPIFTDVNYIKIMVPGDPGNIIDRPVENEIDLRRFGRAYEEWKRSGVQAEGNGTPLEAWPGLTAAQVAQLKYYNVRTVEQLSAMSDANLQNIGPILALRQRARDYVAVAKGEAPLTKVRAELEESNAMIAAMKEQMKQQAEAIEQLRKNQGNGGHQNGQNGQQGKR